MQSPQQRVGPAAGHPFLLGLLGGAVLAGAGAAGYILAAEPSHRPEFLDIRPPPVQTVAQPAAPAATPDQQGTAIQTPVGFAGVVRVVKPTVVTIRVRMRPATQTPFGWMPGNPEQGGGSGIGSGFFVSSDGYIVTNNHVVEDAQQVDVVTEDGQRLTARLIGTDPESDIALLKVNGGPYPFLTLMAGSPEVGDWVLAIGNPFGLGGTVTAGIVSALGREISNNTFDRYIQIDAPVNRGNSGGPAVDMHGQAVGVNSAIFSPSGGSVGIAFVVPSTTVKRVIGDLLQHGRVERGWLGVEAQTLAPNLARSLGLGSAKGVVIANVAAGGPAAMGGLRPGDVITEVNNQPVETARDLVLKVADNKPGTQVKLTVLANGAQRDATVTLGPRATQARSPQSTFGRGR